jgi:membrane protein YqaA with SNARE-associated domain
MLRRFYDWTLALASHRRALPALAAVSFTESSFFPVPPDAMLVPMVLARPDRAWIMAGVCTVASVIGGLFGYAIGYFLFETLGQWLIKVYGYGDAFTQYQEGFAEWGTWIILIKGLTPIPYKLVTIASGLAQFDIFTFVWASVVTRGARFFLVAALLWRFGPPIKDFIEKRLTLVTTLFVIGVIGGFLALRYVF